MSHIISDGEKSISRRDLITRASGLAVAAVVPQAISGSREPAWAGSAQEAFPRKHDFSIPEGITYLNGAYTVSYTHLTLPTKA